VADLVRAYDLVIFDLDGVLYLSDVAVAGAPEAVRRLRDEHMAVAFATNNASRLGKEVAALLTELGMPAAEDEVVTSARAAARVVAEQLPAGSAVLVVGAPALRDEVSAVGLRPVGVAGDAPQVVLQGYGPTVGWADLAEASVAIRAGARWVATNVDKTLPSPRGPLPGNGSLVAALATALGRQPDLVVGKPDPALFVAAAQARGATKALAVGDRLDTDIEGANRAGMDSLLVLTGVSQPVDLLTARPEQRPTYVAENLSGLWDDGDRAQVVPGDEELTWTVTERDGRWELSGHGRPLDALRALCAAVWGGQKADERPAVTADGTAAQDALRVLGL
jgi:glycerol 3-phosphatase-2